MASLSGESLGYPRRSTHTTTALPAAAVTVPAPREAWWRLYREDDEALPSHSPQWLDGMCGFTGHADASRLYEFDDGQELLLPLVRSGRLPPALSPHAAFPLGWSVGGVLARKPIEAQHMRVVAADLARARFLLLNILPNPRQSREWEAGFQGVAPQAAPAARGATPAGLRRPPLWRIPRRAHVVDLEGGFERLHDQVFTKKTRQGIRKALRAGVTIESGTSESLLEAFLELRRRSVDRWAQQQNEPRRLAHVRANRLEPPDKLAHLARHLGGKLRVYVARHGGEAVAASVVVIDRNADELLGAMDKDLAAPVAANDLLQATTFEDACNAGCRVSHLGESGFSPGIAHFKERFGAQAYDYFEYRIERVPVSRLDFALRTAVKRLIGFRDV